MKRLLQRWQLTSARVLGTIVVFAAIGFFLVFRLVAATHLLATPSEQQNMLHGWHALAHNPLDAPYYVLLRLVRYFNHSLFYARLVGAGLGLLLSVLFYYIVRKWLNHRLALIAVVLFGTNSYFLHASRSVSALTLQMFVSLGLIALWTATHKNTSPRLRWLWAVAVPLILYVPGAVWLVLAALIAGRARLSNAWSRQNLVHKALLGLTSLALLAPLGYYLASQTIQTGSGSALESWAGVPQHGGLTALTDFGKAFVLAPVHLFWSGDTGGIAALPALGIAMTILALLGLSTMLKRRHDSRWGFTLISLAAAWLAVGLGGMSLNVLIPILYLLAAVGLAYLLSEWYKVFPRNPIARGVGFLLVAAVVALSCLYNLRVYFVVGTHNKATVNMFICPTAPPRPAVCPQGTV